jgi:tetratricopeptide (TPR) repeat protein
MPLSSIYRSISLILLIGSLSSVEAQPVTLPRTPSPAAGVSQTIGISKVSVNYSRPSVKGRKIWGGLVPYGWNKQGFGNGNSAPWRAGANENTVLTLSDDATIEGHEVPAGSYGLFFTINEDNTGEVILSKEYKSWGSFFYEEAKDEMRAKIQLKEAPMHEMLTYEFQNDTKNDAELMLMWEKKAFPVKIAFKTDEIVIANASQELKGATGFTPQGFISAANYTLQNKAGYDKGIEWIDQAIKQQKTFTTLNIKSRLLTATGNTASSDSLMKEAMVLANEAELNNYGYQLLNDGEKEAALSVFQMTTKRYPKSANAWDSLGEGYAITGDRKNAILSFKKSLTLNPTDATRLNSEKYLKQLNAM